MYLSETSVVELEVGSCIDIINNKARSMQNTDRWRSDQFQPTHIWNPWSNKTDANLKDSACTVRVVLFFPIDKMQIFTYKEVNGSFSFGQ